MTWPGGSSCPITFCHVEGKELSLAVSTEEGSEDSKSNQQEVRTVVCIISKIILLYFKLIKNQPKEKDGK